VIAAAAITLALAAPSREALIGRWLEANRAHTVARLDAGPRAVSNPAAKLPDLRSLAQRELSVRGRYQIGSPPAPVMGQTWWQRAWNWIGDRWHRFWEALFGRAHVGRAAAADVGDGLLVLIGLLFLYVVIRVFVGVQLERSSLRMKSAPVADPPSPRGLYKRACAAAAGGDYGAAALLLFAATVALLDRQGAVDAASSATVGDLRRSLRAHRASLVAPFDIVAMPFVQRAYAERAVDESQWERARSAFENLSGAQA
jgi:hypothetical protein